MTSVVCTTISNFGVFLSVFATAILSSNYLINASSMVEDTLPYPSILVGNDLQKADETLSATPPVPPLTTKQVVVLANTTYLLQWNSIPTTFRYIVFQAHSQWRPLIMSYDAQAVFGNQVNSTNTGLVVLLTPGQAAASVYLTNPHGDNITAMIVSAGYSEQVPIPGACNMEFDVSIAPYLQMTYNKLKTTVEYQRANVGYPRSVSKPPSCDKSTSELEYYMYHYFMKERNLAEEEYFRAIEAMLTTDSVQKSAMQGTMLQLGPQTRSSFNAIPGQGVVYNVVVRNTGNQSWSVAYTPAASYSCDLSNPVDSCNLPIRPFGWIFCVISAFVGLFLCFFGHRYFKTAMFIFGFLTIALMTFVFITKFTKTTYAVRVSMTMLVGIVGGMTWVVFWWFAGVPVLSVLLMGLDLGFLVACIVFYTPFGDLEALKNDTNYWLTLTCIMLIPGLFLVCTMHKMSIVSCAVIGSYGSILLLDLYLGTSLVYIILNVLKRAVIEDFYKINANTPFQINEMALSAVWIFLALAGITFQVLRERKRPPFPPPPYLTWRARALLAAYGAVPSTSSDGLEDERQPLLGGTTAPQNYQSAQETAAPYSGKPPI